MTYIADQSWSPEPTRLGALESSLDRATQEYLLRLGVTRGWHCLEAGAGSGSIARWLSNEVGTQGYVLAIDLDTSLLGTSDPPLEVRQCDLMRAELPQARFDLAHARLLLGHLPAREQAIERLVSTLKPGGWLLIEEADFIWTELGDGLITADSATAVKDLLNDQNVTLTASPVVSVWGRRPASPSASAK